MKRICLVWLALCLCLVVNAQGLVPKSWTAYGLTFDAPQGLRVEEDTEDTYLLNSSRFYITLQALDSDDITQGELDELLIALAKDDGVKELTPTCFTVKSSKIMSQIWRLPDIPGLHW